MSAKTILQRLRFCDPTLPATMPDQTSGSINTENWIRDRQSTYWKLTSDGLHALQGITLNSGNTLSADTFFNGFFLRYWQQLTAVSSLGLSSGQFRFEVFAIAEDCSEISLLKQELANTAAENEISIPIPFTIDTASPIRIAFTLTALQDNSQLLGGNWYTTDSPPTVVSLSILIPTFNRPRFTERTVQRILGDPGLLSEDLHIWLVDQSDTPELSHLEGNRCHIICQPNLGSTGGYTRALYECLHGSHDRKSTHVLFMDDDVDLETDSILRSIRLHQFAREPFILGGPMMDLYQPSIIPNLGCRFSKEKTPFYWLTEHLKTHSATAQEDLQDMSKPVVTDVGAWWFSVFPTTVIESIGLPIPFFLKMDDIEYSVRARHQHVPLYVIPGIGLWHMPFDHKRSGIVDYTTAYNTILVNAYFGIEEGMSAFRYISRRCIDASPR